MNAQQLKNSILQEAIEGRLVPQDPNDEPASVLLDKIRKEKEKQVKKGKLKKKDLQEAPISEDEVPFKVNSGWEYVKLSFILSLIDGEKKQGNYVCLDAKYLRGKSSGNIFSQGRYVQKNDHIILVDGENSGEVFTVPCDGYMGSTFKQLWVSNELYLPYILYFIKAHKDILRNSKKGAAIPHLNKDLFYNLVIGIPPLAEQHRIVEKIEELMPKVEEYGKAQEALDKLNTVLPEQLKKSILQEAIEGRLVPQYPNDEPASVLLDKIRKEKEKLVKVKKLKKSALKENPISDKEKFFPVPKTWVWCKLGWIGDWGAGATPNKGVSEFYSNGTIPWIRTGELNNSIIYDSEIKVTPYALQKCSLRECKIGDVLIAMYGATIGKVAIAGIELTTNQACCACTPYIVYNKYILYYLMANKQRFIDMGAGGAQPNISREKIINFPFPLPPLAEQHRIVEKIEELLRKIENIKEQIKR